MMIKFLYQADCIVQIYSDNSNSANKDFGIIKHNDYNEAVYKLTDIKTLEIELDSKNRHNLISAEFFRKNWFNGVYGLASTFISADVLISPQKWKLFFKNVEHSIMEIKLSWKYNNNVLNGHKIFIFVNKQFQKCYRDGH